jgi:hypothetical protein
MEAYRHNRLTIELHNDEVDTMREVLRLAHDRLRNAELVQMKGSPLQRQAGLVGPDLFRAKDMLEKLGKHLGIELPMDAGPDEVTVVITPVGFGAMPARMHEVLNEMIGQAVSHSRKGE